MADLTVRIVTPEYISVIDGVQSLHLRAVDGELTVLPRHYPLIAAVDVTAVRLRKGNLLIHAFAGEGVMNVREKEVVLLLSAFEFRDDIDLDRAKASYQRAYQRLQSHSGDIDVRRAEAALKRASTRISIAEQ